MTRLPEGFWLPKRDIEIKRIKLPFSTEDDPINVYWDLKDGINITLLAACSLAGVKSSSVFEMLYEAADHFNQYQRLNGRRDRIVLNTESLDMHERAIATGLTSSRVFDITTINCISRSVQNVPMYQQL